MTRYYPAEIDPNVRVDGRPLIWHAWTSRASRRPLSALAMAEAMASDWARAAVATLDEYGQAVWHGDSDTLR